MAIYVFDMGLLASIMSQGVLIYIHFTLLTFTPEQICLPHATCMSDFIAIVVYTDTHSTAHIHSKNNKLQDLFHILFPDIYQVQLSSPNAI